MLPEATQVLIREVELYTSTCSTDIQQRLEQVEGLQ